MERVILQNQLVIMEGVLYGFWDSYKGVYTTDSEYINDLKGQIKITKQAIKRLPI